nr:unnamed protein product [Callosobruchus analis]
MEKKSNFYAQQKSLPDDITRNEILCFIRLLLLSGYSSVSRRRMYRHNSDDTNKMVCDAISRDRFQYCNDNNNLDKDDRPPKNAQEYSRYDRLDHLVVYQEQQRRFICHICTVSLNPKGCFHNYHTH